MKETYWGYWLILLGVFIIGVMMLVNSITTTNTQDYYNVKEVTQASMVDAIDFSYYRLYGNLKINEQKFVENFARRFSENLNLANTYNIDFYDLYEVPPKVSVRISTGSNAVNIANTTNNSYDVVTTFSAVLELGKSAESSGGDKNNDKDRTTCSIDEWEKLMKYLQSGNVKDEVRDLFGSAYNDLVNAKDTDTFGDRFGTWFTTEGCNSGCGNVPYSNWPSALRWLEEQNLFRIRNQKTNNNN